MALPLGEDTGKQGVGPERAGVEFQGLER